MGMSAISGLKNGEDGLVIVENGKLKAIASFRKDTLVENSIEIRYLATAERGYGVNMMRAAGQVIAGQGQGMSWVSTGAARGFHEKLGFLGGEGHNAFAVNNTQLKEWLKQPVTKSVDRLSKQELEELEPEDGTFVEAVEED